MGEAPLVSSYSHRPKGLRLVLNNLALSGLLFVKHVGSCMLHVPPFLTSGSRLPPHDCMQQNGLNSFSLIWFFSRSFSNNSSPFIIPKKKKKGKKRGSGSEKIKDILFLLRRKLFSQFSCPFLHLILTIHVTVQ